jgi:hypothetical protein
VLLPEKEPGDLGCRRERECCFSLYALVAFDVFATFI